MKTHFLWSLLLLLPLYSIQAQTFTLTSSDLNGQFTNQAVFGGFGCTGKNQSPQLVWNNAPAQTKSFAITMYDPDAPTGSGWWHWVVFDLPATTTLLKAGSGETGSKALPVNAIQSLTDYGTQGYGGPCPPEGDAPHRYIITVYALDIPTLGLDANATPALVGYYLNSHALGKASILSYFGR